MKDWKKTEVEFVDAFKPLGKRAYVARLADTAAAKATGGKEAILQAQPSDFLLTVDGDTHYAEVKSSTNKTSFPFSNIKRGQWIASRRVVGAGGSYLFFIKNLVTKVWYVVPALVLHKHNRKSIKWAEIEDYQWTSPT